MFVFSSGSTPCGRKGAISCFSFRLDERAEKRKEVSQWIDFSSFNKFFISNYSISFFSQFFTKLEEKNHAKEMEKTNLQARSKVTSSREFKMIFFFL